MTGDEKVVYCLMRKIGDGGNFLRTKPRKNFGKSGSFERDSQIAMFRGIFRVTDFNLRNILIDDDGSLVSIDEGEIGKRKSIFGGREKWLKKHLTNAIMNKAYSIFGMTIGEKRKLQADEKLDIVKIQLMK